MFDGGIRSGQDVMRALALGAKSCLIGRAYIYGLGAGGEAGVAQGDRDHPQGARRHHGADRRQEHQRDRPARPDELRFGCDPAKQDLDFQASRIARTVRYSSAHRLGVRMAEQQTTRRLAAILAADVAGYSSMMGTTRQERLQRCARFGARLSTPPSPRVMAASSR